VLAEAIVAVPHVARTARREHDMLSDPSRTRKDDGVGVAPVKVGPSAYASRTADAAPLTAAPSDANWQRGP
jgi:hypothetical protein